MTEARKKYDPIIISLGVATVLWLLDAFLETFLMRNGTLIETLFTAIPSDKLVMRILALIVFALSGIIMSYSRARKLEIVTALQQSQSQFRLLLDSTTDAIAIVDYEGIILEVNQLASSWIGRQPQECTGHQLRDVLENELADQLLMQTRRVIETREGIASDFATPFKDTEYWCRLRIQPVASDASGEAIVALCLARDITQHKQMEEALRTSEERYRSVVETAKDAIVTIDHRGQIAFWNRSAEKMFGYSTEEMAGQPASKLLPEKSRPGFESAIAAGEVFKHQNKSSSMGVRKDGSHFPIEISLEQWQAGHDIFFTGIVRDVTERVQAEETLRVFSQVVDSMVDAVVITNLNGKITYANKAALEQTGYSEEALLGQHPMYLVVEADRERLTRHGAAVLAEQARAADIVCQLARRDGSEPPASISFSILRDSSEKPAGVVAVSRDISERLRLENERRESDERYRSFVENFQGIAFRGDMEFGPEFMHGAIEAITGYTEEEANADDFRWDQIIHPNDMSALLTESPQLRTIPGFSTEFEYRIVRKDGGIHWVRETLQNVCNENGVPVKVQGAIYDITEKKETEDALRLLHAELEQRVADRTRHLSTLNDIANVVSHTLDRDTILSDSLQAVLETLGLEAGVIYVKNESTGELDLVIERGLGDDTKHHAPPTSLLHGAIADGKLMVIEDLTLEPDRFDRMIAEGWRGLICVPLIANAQVNGVLAIASRQADRFTIEDIELLASIGNQIGIAIDNARLYQHAQQLAVVKERQRLARELHDSVTQALYGAMLYARAATGQLSNGKLDAVEKYLHELKETTQEALAEMRLLIYELRPSALEAEGMVSALQARLQAVEERAGVKTQFAIDGIGQLPSEIEDGLYRIAQESLNNSLKHSQARAVTLDLRQIGRTVTLEVRDDGIGFDPAIVVDQGGMGLATMRERIVSLGGKLHIDSHPGSGARVLAEVCI